MSMSLEYIVFGQLVAADALGNVYMVPMRNILGDIEEETVVLVVDIVSANDDPEKLPISFTDIWSIS